MIISSIHAENVLKYTHLDLNNLPATGIIAISGYNESGKSTIGEAICFVLFGRTFSLESTQIKKIIHWGASHCSVTITFQQGNEHYRLSRFLDHDGNHSAKVTHLPSELAIASGIPAVANTVSDILGYDFDDFISSFYLAQREITAPHPRSETIKVMTGIAPLELAMKDIDIEIAREEQEITINEQRISEVNSDLDELAFDKTRLRTLRKQYTTHNDILSELRRQAKGLEQAQRRYKETLPVIQATYTLQGITKFMSSLLLLLTMLVSGGWLLITQFPEYWLTHWLTAYLENLLSAWIKNQYEYLEWSLFSAIGTLIWCLFFWIMNMILKRRIKRLDGERINLAAMLRKIYHNASVYRAIETSEVDPIPNKTMSLPIIEYPADDEVHQITQLLVDNAAAIMQTENIINRTLSWLNILARHYEQTVSSLDATIIREEEKLSKVERCEEMSNKLQASIKEHHQRIVVRRLANELLQGACGRIAQHFNRDVRDLMGVSLPLFTDGRYQYLHIDNELNVRIFSKEKYDFMDLDEASSGTQRQTMLALRLALARQLLERTKGVPQFLFLDEPFAFFDESRTHHSLEVLPKLSDKLNQIWIVAQAFPEDIKSHFSKHIECRNDT